MTYREERDQSAYNQLMIEHEAVLRELEREREDHDATRRSSVRGRWRIFVTTTAVAIGASIGIGLFLVAQSSCVACLSREELEAGIVTNKHYHEAYTTCTSSGKTTVCTTHPERWTIVVANEGETGSFDVAQTTFDATNVGEWSCEGVGCGKPRARTAKEGRDAHTR